MMDKVDEQPQAEHGQEDGQGHRNVRHKDGRFHAPNGSQHQQAVNEGRKKRAQDDLVAGIAYVIVQQPRAELR